MKPVYDEGGITLYQGCCLDVLRQLPDASVNTCVTSPPYWGLRDYGVAGQLGLEPTPAEYVANMVSVFREVKRVLRDDGTVWINLGDSYNGVGGPGKQNGGPIGPTAAIAIDGTKGRRVVGLKQKDLVGIPWSVAFALRDDGWYLRSDIIWSKPNPMPESVTDRPTKAHEYLFLLSKSERYYYDAEAIKENINQVYTRTATPNERLIERTRAGSAFCASTSPNNGFGRDITTIGRNKRSVWEISTQPFPEAHFATFPPKLIEPCILAGCPDGGTVLDCFNGAGTTGLVCQQQHVRYVGIELNPDYCDISIKRWAQQTLPFVGGAA